MLARRRDPPGLLLGPRRLRVKEGAVAFEFLGPGGDRRRVPPSGRGRGRPTPPFPAPNNEGRPRRGPVVLLSTPPSHGNGTGGGRWFVRP